jgi:hypothetical protein
MVAGLNPWNVLSLREITFYLKMQAVIVNTYPQLEPVKLQPSVKESVAQDKFLELEPMKQNSLRIPVNVVALLTSQVLSLLLTKLLRKIFEAALCGLFFF